ncbi:hypothetical protein FSP39_019871 [Pinctada imbricata]|uniref:RanBP2-type domain-containing protein n=1 Tax=Pinctada imbricata TaxID=66713 RepID=A0AA88YLZ6_PINIB|nr:hypothetical protein FSP39_019871 [Pinctada imbricata]
MFTPKLFLPRHFTPSNLALSIFTPQGIFSPVSHKRSKRHKPLEEESWDCSVCTFKNPIEAYKCEMCDVRKGTSTRKPRLNAQIAAQQVAQQYVPPPPKKEKSGATFMRSESINSLTNNNESSNDSYDTHLHHQIDSAIDTKTVVTTNSDKNVVANAEKIQANSEKNTNSSSALSKKNRTPKLRNIDRSSAQEMRVTVGSVTVVITDYKPKKERKISTDLHSNILSDSSDNSSQGPLNGHTKDISDQRTH